MRKAPMMMRRAWLALAAVALLQPAGVARAQELSGPDVWAANCSRCHRLRGVDSFSREQWSSIVTHMSLAARLTPAESRAVREFLAPEPQRDAAAPSQRPVQLASAAVTDVDPPLAFMGTQTTPAVPVRGSDVYRTKCAACHGPLGRGDGPTARRLRTPPRDLTNTSGLTLETDSAIADLIRTGRRGMPSFPRLTAAQVDSVIAYVKSLRQ